MTSVDLGLIGNGTLGALVSRDAEIVWMCVPRFDGDPVFCSLLRGAAEPREDGAFAVEMIDAERTEQEYIPDTAVLVTRFFDANGAVVEVTDFAPRFLRDGELFTPLMLVRKIVRVSGEPKIRVRVRPMQEYGATIIAAESSRENYLRYAGENLSMRVTTDAPLDAMLEETPFALDGAITLVFGPDEEIPDGPSQTGGDFLEQTLAWWRDWVNSLNPPNEWRDAVVRAAITLKLNVSEKSGSIIAAMTTSIPEAPNSGRNWDYRYCWMRDAYFVAAALERLGDRATTEQYVGFLKKLVAQTGSELGPMYTIDGGPIPVERMISHLPGYRGMGPVRIGNEARVQKQHDVYGEVILAAKPLFFDDNVRDRVGADLFGILEPLGDQAADLFDKPDAGLWELRGTQRVHTFSSVMCWAACSALADMAEQLRLSEKTALWRDRADHIHETISRRAWNARLGAFTAALEGDTLDASLLLMQPLGFIGADDERYKSTVRAIGRDLRRGDFIYRYIDSDDFGRPENAFLVCTFWYIDALAAIGDHDEARKLFERVLSRRNQHGLLAEDIDPKSGEQWGNFVQTYSMAGIIDSAMRLTSATS